MAKEISLSQDLNVITKEIKDFQQNINRSIFEIGERLNHVKENDLVHGEFGKWLESININQNTANRYMKIVKELDYDTYHNLGSNALYLIATIPPEEREKEHTLSSGKTKKLTDMTVKEIREVKNPPKNTEAKKTNRRENVKLREESQNTKHAEDEDGFQYQLLMVDVNLHGKLRELDFGENLHIAHWLSQFTEEKQKQIEDIRLSLEFKTMFKDGNKPFFYDYIRYTPITGKQFNRLAKLMWKNEQIIIFDQIMFFSVMDGISYHNKLDKAKTTDEIDVILDEFEQEIEQIMENSERKEKRSKQRRSSYSNTYQSDNSKQSSQSDYNWSQFFSTGTITTTDYRKELGLHSTATDKEVRKEFRSLMKVLHPDTGGTNNAVFKKYSEMYEEFKKSIRVAS